MLSLLAQRAILSLTTFPTASGWYKVAGVTLATTATAGLTATATGFVDPLKDWKPPTDNPLRPLSALVFPSLFEELIWRGAFLPSPSSIIINSSSSAAALLPPYYWAGMVLVVHVLMHPVAAATIWPRGRDLFGEPRFLLLATIVLGGATASYIMSGGSVWAAAVTHGIPVALWRDFFGGDEKLSKLMVDDKKRN
jgi:predicted Abi (CAAX) family protease